LPSTLNETYDSILLRIKNPSHQELANTALHRIAVAQQPLRVEQLIEACTVKLEAGGRICEDLRLSPAEIVMLLRHLAALEKNVAADDFASTASCKKDYLVFAHFSVREYLTTPRYMASAIRLSFAVELKQAHLDVASSCIAYLLRTNSLEERGNRFSLREYAWDLWALHAVLSMTDATIETSNRAQELYEKVAFGNDYDVPNDLQRVVCWADSTRAVLKCLRNPYFFEEWDGCEWSLDNLHDHKPSGENNELRFLREVPDHNYKPLDVKNNELRLLEIVPNQNRFAGVRCRMIYTSLTAHPEYHVVSYTHGSSMPMKCIWLDAHRLAVPAYGQASIRAIRSLTPQGRLVWVESICLNQSNHSEMEEQMPRIPSIFDAAGSVTVYVDHTSGNKVWAMEIIRLVDQLLKKHSDNTFNDLANLLLSRPTTNPFACLKLLFTSPWWARSWTLEQVIFGKTPVLLYGEYTLPWICVQNFVALAAQAFQLISHASHNYGHDPAVLEDTIQWENVVGLVGLRVQLHHGTEPRNVIQLLYASRYREQSDPRDRIYSLCSLMPPGAPAVDYRLTVLQVVQEFCSYTLLLTNNLDLFTLYFPEKPTRYVETDFGHALPSWAGYCQSWSTCIKIPRPLLYQELVTRADGPFCAGGREFREAPAILQDKQILHLEGFLIDTIGATHGHSPGFQYDQAQLEHKGYAKFSAQRHWFRAAGGLAVLGPEQTRVGSMLAILIGGKTPYLLEGIPEIANNFILIGEWYVRSQCFRNAQDKTLTRTVMWTV
jgi:hypothetical protein